MKICQYRLNSVAKFSRYKLKGGRWKRVGSNNRILPISGE